MSYPYPYPTVKRDGEYIVYRLHYEDAEGLAMLLAKPDDTGWNGDAKKIREICRAIEEEEAAR